MSPQKVPCAMPAPHLPQTSGFGSQLTQQIQREKELQSDMPLNAVDDPPSAEKKDGSRSSSKSRSLSDAPKPSLSPSPAFREPTRTTKDDISLVSTPITPRRPNFPVRGLSLQMPPLELGSPGSGSFVNRVPLSPKLDSSNSYGAPASVLPRRSRGLDFSRACTNLHHSTLAESSPDSSPTITGRGMLIPPHNGLSNTSGVHESPSNVSNSLWSTMGNADRTTMSGSVSSVNMLDSDSGSTDSDDDEPMEQGEGEGEDSVITTPQVYKLGSTMANPFASGTISSPGQEWMSNYSPAAASLMSFQRARLRAGRSRKSSSSVSGNSSKPSPGPLSPPLLKSIESANSGYFSNEWTKRETQSRRESLSLGTHDLHLSDGSDEGEGRPNCNSSSSSGAIPGTPTADGGRPVIKRAVTRRGNLLVSLE